MHIIHYSLFKKTYSGSVNMLPIFKFLKACFSISGCLCPVNLRYKRVNKLAAKLNMVCSPHQNGFLNKLVAFTGIVGNAGPVTSPIILNITQLAWNI